MRYDTVGTALWLGIPYCLRWSFYLRMYVFTGRFGAWLGVRFRDGGEGRWGWGWGWGRGREKSRERKREKGERYRGCCTDDGRCGLIY